MDKEKSKQPLQDQGTGRISNIDGTGTTDPHRDISSIDRQEGEMDHGETGGNFKTGDPGKREQGENQDT